MNLPFVLFVPLCGGSFVAILCGTARWRALVSERPPFRSRSIELLRLMAAHCLPSIALPISLLARQESDYEMEILVGYCCRFIAAHFH
jgi:hypothetical protein